MAEQARPAGDGVGTGPGAGKPSGASDGAPGKPAAPNQDGDRPTAQDRTDRPGRSAYGSHFDDPDGTGEASAARDSADRRRTVDEGLTMYGTRTSGVVIIGDGLQFNAPIAGGDSIGRRDRPAPLLTEVPARSRAEMREGYVPPADIVRLREPFADHPLLLLGTRPRWGNTTIAVGLFAELRTVYELRFTGSLAALPVEDLPAGCGYLMDSPDGRSIGSLRMQDLQSLEDRLVKTGSRLIVITDVGRPVDQGARPVWRTLSGPPPAYEVVYSQLARRLSDIDVSASNTAEPVRTAGGDEGGGEPAVGSGAAELIEAAGVADELREMTADIFDIHRLVELACALADAARGDSTVEEAAQRFADRARRDVEDWIDGITDTGDLALIASLAVLNGMPFDAVSRAATLLERMWRADEEPGVAREARRRRSRRARLEAARAHLSTQVWQTRYGPAELEVVSFVDDTYPQRILHHLWHEYDYDRDLILQWLRTMAEDVEGRVRTRVAIAIGYLGGFAFDTVRRDVIVPWVGSGNGDERERAVAALALPARNPDTAARAVGLVSEWCGKKSASLRLTAARALGNSVGAVLRDGPDEPLGVLAKGADGRLATALGDSIAELMADADLSRQVALLRLLSSWSTEGRGGRQLAGILGFLEVAWTLWTFDDGMSWPTLLWLAEQGRVAHHVEPARDGHAADPHLVDAGLAAECRTLVAGLWGRALVAPGVDNGVRVVLGSWASTVEREPTLRPAFVSLFTDAVQTSRQAYLLSRHAQLWRDRKPAAPDIARRLLDALTKGAGIRG